jgi:hypothetical protein
VHAKATPTTPDTFRMTAARWCAVEACGLPYLIDVMLALFPDDQPQLAALAEVAPQVVLLGERPPVQVDCVFAPRVRTAKAQGPQRQAHLLGPVREDLGERQHAQRLSYHPCESAEARALDWSPTLLPGTSRQKAWRSDERHSGAHSGGTGTTTVRPVIMVCR